MGMNKALVERVDAAKKQANEVLLMGEPELIPMMESTVSNIRGLLSEISRPTYKASVELDRINADERNDLRKLYEKQVELKKKREEIERINKKKTPIGAMIASAIASPIALFFSMIKYIIIIELIIVVVGVLVLIVDIFSGKPIDHVNSIMTSANAIITGGGTLIAIIGGIAMGIIVPMKENRKLDTGLRELNDGISKIETEITELQRFSEETKENARRVKAEYNELASYQKELSSLADRIDALVECEKRKIRLAHEKAEREREEAERRRQRELAEAEHRRAVDEAAKKFDDVVIRTRNNAMERMHIFRDLIDYTVQLFEQAIAAKSAKKYEKEIKCEFSYEVLSDKIKYDFDRLKNKGKKEEIDDAYSFMEHRKANLSTAEERLGFGWALAVLIANRMQEMQPQCTVEIERREPTDEQKWAQYEVNNRVSLKYSCPNPDYEAEESMV